MSDLTLHEAVEIIARSILSLAADDTQWKDFPDFGQYDFERIVATAKQLAPPWPDRFDEAYELLASRAEDTDAS